MYSTIGALDSSSNLLLRSFFIHPSLKFEAQTLIELVRKTLEPTSYWRTTL